MSRRESEGHLRARILALGAFALAGGGLAGPAAAQDIEAAALHDAAIEALGGRDADRVAFTGAGWDACLGQAWSVEEGWARWELTDYRRVIDYARGTSSQSAMRRAGLDPGRIGGCGAQPDAAPRPQQSYIGGDAAWADQLPIWLTPHGFARLIAAGEPAIEREPSTWKVTLTLTREEVEYTLVGRYNRDFELSSIRTWIDNTVFGDMEVLAEFGEYRDFGDVSLPESLSISQGGFATLSLTIDGAELGAEVGAGDSPRRAGPPAADEGAPWTEIGDGIFAFHGAYQAVAVEFERFSIVVDGLQSDERVRELIELTKQAIPGKPIQYVISTHSHFDHASGLRQFAAEGAVILTHALNVPFFEQALSAPRTLRRDPIEPSEVPVSVQGIDGRFVISDGSGQLVELHPLGPSAHAADMLVVHLPSIGAIVEADVLQPWINPIFGGDDGPHPFLVYLHDELERLGIDYEQFVPIHEPPEPPAMPRSALEDAVAGAVRR